MLNLVEIALADWSAIPDADIPAVCARARVKAATKPNQNGFTPIATTGEVLAAWREISQEAHHNEFWRKRRAEESLIASGRAIPAPTLATMAPEAQEAFWDNFYKSAGIARPR